MEKIEVESFLQKDKQQRINELYTIILERKSLLKSTDYIAAKIAEGAATREEYAEKIQQRKQWRADINDAQAEIDRINALEDNEHENINDLI